LGKGIINLQKRLKNMEKKFSKTMLMVLFLSALTLAVIMTPLVKAQTTSLSPTSGSAGSTVTATVSGFSASEPVTLQWPPNLYLGTITTDTTGSGSATFTVPQVAAGTYTFSATGQNSGDIALVSFTVTGTTATPTAAPTAAPTATPVSTPAPTPSTIPEFPTWIILPLFAVIALLSTLFVRKRMLKKIAPFLFFFYPYFSNDAVLIYQLH
jgi:hypothetical protein